MVDFSKAVDAFQQGANWRQQFRANRQFERAREQALEEGGAKLFDKRESAKALAQNLKDDYGIDTPLYEHMGLQDPFAFKLLDWFKARKAKKMAKKRAIDLGGEGDYTTSNPVGTGDEPPLAAADDTGAQAFPLEDAPI